MTEREIIQFVSMLVTIGTMLVMIAMSRRGVLNWRYILLPLLVSSQQVVFYIFIFIQSPAPSETITTWSSVIRLETALAFLVVLLAYWHTHEVTHKVHDSLETDKLNGE